MSSPRVYDSFDRRKIDMARRGLWDEPTKGTDVYFNRSLAICKEFGINPWVQRQMFVRLKKGAETGKVAGIEEVLAVHEHFTPFFQNGGRIWAVPNGTDFNSTETLIVTEGRFWDTVQLETIALGNWSRAMTESHLGIHTHDLSRVANVFEAANREMDRSPYGRRSLNYFGCRHYANNLDGRIAFQAIQGGATSTATEGSAYVFSRPASGTIPHALQNVFAWHIGRVQGWQAGYDQACSQAALAFHKTINRNVNRVTLADYRGMEITDTIQSAKLIAEADGRLFGTRLDTNGANVAEGALPDLEGDLANEWRRNGIYLPKPGDHTAKYWAGKGVTVSSAIAMYLALAKTPYSYVKSFLTSGMSNPLKVRAFVDAEIALTQDKVIDSPLFVGIGIGEVLEGIFGTDDIIAVGESPEKMVCLHKKGRPPKRNDKLVPAMGDCPTQHPIMGAKLFDEFGYER